MRRDSVGPLDSDLQFPPEKRSKVTDEKRLFEPADSRELLRGWLLHAHKGVTDMIVLPGITKTAGLVSACRRLFSPQRWALPFSLRLGIPLQSGHKCRSAS